MCNLAWFFVIIIIHFCGCSYAQKGNLLENFQVYTVFKVIMLIDCFIDFFPFK